MIWTATLMSSHPRCLWMQFCPFALKKCKSSSASICGKMERQTQKLQQIKVLVRTSDMARKLLGNRSIWARNRALEILVHDEIDASCGCLGTKTCMWTSSEPHGFGKRSAEFCRTLMMSGYVFLYLDIMAKVKSYKYHPNEEEPARDNPF